MFPFPEFSTIFRLPGRICVHTGTNLIIMNLKSVSSNNQKRVRKSGAGKNSKSDKKSRRNAGRGASRDNLVGGSIDDFVQEVKAEYDVKEDIMSLDTVREEKKMEATELRVHHWLVYGTRHRLLEFGIEYVDGPAGLNGKFTYMGVGDKIVRHVSGPVFEVVPAERYEEMSSDWSSREYVARACESAADGMVVDAKLSLEVLVRKVLLSLKKFVTPWPTAEQDIAAYLVCEEFQTFLQKHRSGRRRIAYNSRISLAVVEVWNERHPARDIDEETFQYHCKLLKEEVEYRYDFDWADRSYLDNVWLVVKFVFFMLFSCAICCSRNKRYRLVMRLFAKYEQLSAAGEQKWFKFASAINYQRTCSKHLENLPEMDVRAQCQRPHSWEKDCPERKIGCFGTSIPDAPLAIPMQCAHDQYNGLRIRFVFARDLVLDTTQRWFESAQKFVQGFSSLGSWKNYSDAEWLVHLKPSRMRKIVDTLMPERLKDFVPVDIFVKLEAYIGKTCENFKPRIIQGRRLAYQKVVGSYFYSIGKWLGTVFVEANGNWIYDSGLSAITLGRLAQRCFGYKHVYELDVSNWDGSVGDFMLRFEKWFVEQAPDKHPLWAEIKQFWSVMEGVGKDGVSYNCPWGRRSGDMWTSCFNSLINLTLVQFVFGNDTLAIAKGDDGFIGTNSDISVDKIISIYKELGMVLKVKEVFHICDLGYCSGSFYPTDVGYKWGVAPFRVLSKFGLNLHQQPLVNHKRLLFGTAMSMMPIAGHVPFLGALFRSIIKDGEKSGLLPIFPTFEEWKTTSETVEEVNFECYNEFAKKFGWSLNTVFEVEHAFSKVKLDDFPLVLSNSLFLEGFCTEVDVEPRLDTAQVVYRPDSKVVKVESNSIYWFNYLYVGNNLFLAVVFFVPLLEEVLGALVGQYAKIALLASYEYQDSLLPFLIHILISLFGCLFNRASDRLLARVFIHSLYNWLVFCAQRTTFGSAIQNRIDIATKKNGNNNQKRGLRKAKGSKKPKPPSGRGSFGRKFLTTAGTALGGILGGPIGSTLGDVGANWLSDVLGMGDYEVKGNSLMNAQSGVPSFGASEHTVRIRHREYLGDVTGSLGFQLFNSYTLNPGVSTTFPWLSRIAKNFQSYKLLGCLFEFNSTSADALASVNTALGTVVMATQYNTTAPLFTSKAEMEQYEYSCSSRPSKSLIHPVECLPAENVMDHLYVRNDNITVSSPQFYDLGVFQLATTGMQAAATIGELWITYDVELYKPRIDPGGTWPGQYAHFTNLLATTTDPLGPIQVNPIGTLPVEALADNIIFPETITGGRFLVMIAWSGGAAVLGGVVPDNMVGITSALYGGYNSMFVEDGNAIFTGVFDVEGYQFGGSSLTFTVTLTGTTNVDIYVVSLPILGPDV